MRILVGLFVYNEIRYLPEFIDYYTKQGCEFVFVDNYSTDGTYEYLMEKGMSVSRIDTNESFDEIILVKALEDAVIAAKPDWFIFTGADLYYSFDNPIREEIELADKEGFDQLAVRCYYMHNTGEEFKTPLQNNYFWGMYREEFVMIGRFKEGFRLTADNISFVHPKIKPMDGWMFNYGGCKPASEQEIKLQRRQKSWDAGLPMAVGWHHLEAKNRNFIWNKESVEHLPSIPGVWRYLKKIMT